MTQKNIIAKLKKSGLVGRSGSCFPTGLKWEMVKKAKADKKYIVCNASEGEPKNEKDKFILEKYPAEVVEGVKIALETIDNSSAYIYLRKDYYQKFKKKLEKLSNGLSIEFVKKIGGYLSGEETVLCNVIEGKKPEPKIKPPFPVESGIFGYPTLVCNVETFYSVSKIAKGEYKNTRFYTIAGDVKNPGVFEFFEKMSINQILKNTGNYPGFDFFAQVGGGASGEILLPRELNQSVKGAGVIIIFDSKKTDNWKLMKQWADFFLAANCDKCVPCREGVYRISKMIEEKKIDKKLFEDILFVMRETSFCSLGKCAVIPFESLIKKILKI